MLRLIPVLLLLATFMAGQERQPAPDPQQLAALFGPAFKPDAAFPVLTGDLDGDGKEDAVVAVTSSDNPLLDEATYHYRVVDPYHAYFGFGDPKITAQFAAQDRNPHLLLVVHNWRAPQQKFVIENIAFEKLVLGRVMVKKKPLLAIRAQESAGYQSDLYWDGHKWKWQEESIE